MDIDWQRPISETIELQRKESRAGTTKKGLDPHVQHLISDLRISKYKEKDKKKKPKPGSKDESVKAASEKEADADRATYYQEAFEAISRTPPFSFLSSGQRQILAKNVKKKVYTEGQTIIHQGASSRSVYILASGQVLLLNIRCSPPEFICFDSAPTYFGEWEPIFEVTERKAHIIAGGDVVAYKMDEPTFAELLQRRTFRYVLIRIMRNTQKPFAAIEGFISYIMDAVSSRKLDFPRTLSLYKKLSPAIHSKMNSDEIDVAGWMYSIKRLPDNVTQTFVYLLSTAIPEIYLHPRLVATMVSSFTRRRAIFQLSEGKSLVLMREDHTDVIDFISLLCLHVLEAHKLRQRISSPKTFHMLQEFVLQKGTPQQTPRPSVAGSLHVSETKEEQDRILQQLPLSEVECRGLQALWPTDTVQRLWDILVHHEDYTVCLNLNPKNYTGDPVERWAQMVREQAFKLLGTFDLNQGDVIEESSYVADETYCTRVGKNPLDYDHDEDDEEELEVDIVSSNIHCVVNCLSPYLHAKKDAILNWARENNPLPGLDRVPLSDPDKLYILTQLYFKAHPDEERERIAHERKYFGMVTLQETEFTGIQVNLIDLNRIEGKVIDPLLMPFLNRGNTTAADGGKKQKKRLLVNIDYAFGKQAADILSCLILVFGRAIRSVNVMGKAGALQGSRGDIILATHLIFQGDETVTNIKNEGISVENLRGFCGGRTVWPGGVLTVVGTLLQDRNLLHYYKKLWGCVSLEMEGSYYAREVMKYKRLGYLKRSIAMRFVYNVSDLPLQPDSNLSQGMSVAEGIPPMYGISRAILAQILTSG